MLRFLLFRIFVAVHNPLYHFMADLLFQADAIADTPVQIVYPDDAGGSLFLYDIIGESMDRKIPRPRVLEFI